MSDAESSQALAYRLSPQQREAAGGLRTQAAVLVAGDLDVERLASSVRRVLARHEIFRSSFARLPGLASTVQLVAGELPAGAGRAVAGEALRELPGDPLAWLVQRPGRPFQAESGDTVHVEVCGLDAGSSLVVFEASPLCADLWTATALARQIADEYLGAAPPDAHPGLEYADYADWRNELLEEVGEPAAGSSRELWERRRVQAGALPLLQLAAAGSAGPPAEKALAVPVPPGAAARLGGEAALLAGWQMFLARYTGSPEVEVEWLSMGRNRPELASLLGNTALWLPCRARLEPGRTLARAAQASAAEIAEAIRHESAYSAAGHYAARPELAAAAVQLEMHRGWRPRGGAPAISLLAAAGATRPYGLKLACREGSQGWELHLVFSPHRLPEGDVERLSRAFAAFLAGAAADPDRPVDTLPLLSSQERAELLALGGGAVRPAPESIAASFELQAARVPERWAVVAGEERLSYGELSRRANRLARVLLEHGAGPDKLVGVALGRSAEWVVALLAAWRAGAAYLPLPADGSASRALAPLDSRRLAAIVTTSGAASSLPAGAGPLVLVDGDRERIAQRSAAPLDVALDPAMLAYVLLTSGSTGNPKPVGVHHGAIANYAAAVLGELEARRSDAGDGLSFAFVSSLQADLGNTSLFPALASGGCLHLVPEDELLNAEALGRRMQAEAIDVLKIVPSHFASLLAAAGRAVMPRRFLVLGGEACGPELVRHIAEAGGDCRIVNHYGPTETTVGATLCKLPPSGRDGGRPPIGRALANVRLFVVDGWGELAPAGVAGELWVGGAGVARGYLGQPGTTAERFVPDGLSGASGERLYRTGDRVRWRGEGVLEYLGRLDDQVKVRGHRIELGEIESALGSLPGVREAVVVAREDRPGEVRLVGYVVGEGSEESWRQDLRSRLPEVMVPSALMRLERLPLTANGKVDRRGLPAPESGASWEAPRTGAEATLASIWSEVLGCGRVGRQDNFFALGGDSILSIQVVARARQRGLRLTPRQMFDHPTVASLAAVAEASPEVSGEPGEELRSVASGGRTPGDFPLAKLNGEELSRLESCYPDLEDVYPLTPLQSGLMSYALRFPGSSVYCNQMTCTLEGELDGERLRSAWEGLVARHAVLRTAFLWEGLRSPVQVVLGRVELPWRQEDWRDVAEEEQARRLERLVAADRERGHALEHAPLMRVALARTGERRYRFLWSNHHLLLDGWSRSLAVAELLALYAGTASQEPEPPFMGYVAWLQNQDRAAGEAFWSRRLAGAEPALVVERADADPKDDHEKRRVFLGAVLSRQLEAFARRRQVTLNTVMAGVWAIVLSGHCKGREDVVFGATVAGRPGALAGVERMVGLFINTLPVRVRVRSGADLAAWLRQLQSEAAEARQYEYLPLTDVQRWSGLPAGRPLFDSLLVFENFPLLPPPATAGDVRNFVQVGDAEVADHNSYPLTVTVRPGADVEVEIDFVRGAVSEPLAVRLLAAIQAVAGRLAASGDGDRVATLQDELRSMARKEAEVSTQNRREQLLARMKSAAPKPVSFGSPQEIVDLRPYAPDASLPQVVEPRLAGVDLLAWARNQRETLLAALHRSGALLFRGAGAPTPETLQELASIFTSDLLDENGEHPRDAVSGHVYTPVHFSPRHLLLWHNENSFNQRWPRLIWFCCARPADRGGESILVDSREVFARLPEAVREPFVAKGVTYVRRYGEGVGRSWQEVFQTSRREDAEARCRAEGLDFRWLDEQRLVTSCRRPAVVAHPVTGEMSWFNQAQHWHPACLAGEVRDSLDGAFDDDSYPRDCLYGDGTRIADSTMATICETYRRLEVVVPLRAGEILMVDNVLAAHARAPYEGERRLLVALGEMGSFTDSHGTA